MQKEFNNGDVVRISYTDIFKTNVLRWKSFDDTDIYIEGRMRTVPRTLAVTYAREFGNTKFKAKGNRSVGSADEQKRVVN